MTILLAAIAGCLSSLLGAYLADLPWVSRASTTVDPSLLIYFMGPIMVGVVVVHRHGSLYQAALAGLIASLLSLPSSSHEFLTPTSTVWTKFLGSFLWWVFIPGLFVWVKNRVQRVPEKPSESARQ